MAVSVKKKLRHVYVFLKGFVKDSAHVTPWPTTFDELKTRITGAWQEYRRQCSQKVKQDVENRAVELSQGVSAAARLLGLWVRIPLGVLML
jgi:hypothetical protein